MSPDRPCPSPHGWWECFHPSLPSNARTDVSGLDIIGRQTERRDLLVNVVLTLVPALGALLLIVVVVDKISIVNQKDWYGML